VAAMAPLVHRPTIPPPAVIMEQTFLFYQSLTWSKRNSAFWTIWESTDYMPALDLPWEECKVWPPDGSIQIELEE